MKIRSLFRILLACVVLTGFVVPMPSLATSMAPVTRGAPAAVPPAGWLCWNDGSTDPCHNNLRATAAVSASDAWAVGDALLHWNGSAWLRVAAPVASTLNAVTMITSSDAWAVGDAGTILHWDGTNWLVVASTTANALYSVSMVATNDGWAVGDGGILLQWDGNTWTSVTSPTTNALRAVALVSASDGWAVGDGGTILRWNGLDWLDVSGTTTSNPLYGVAKVTATNVWAVGAGGVIVHWNGTTWSTVTSPTTSDLNSVAMTSASDGWAVGGSGAIVHWNGSAWSVATSPISSTGWLNGVVMTSSTNGWAVGDAGLIVRWNGSAWTLVSSPNYNWLYSVAMDSVSDGWAAGEVGTLRHWNGTTWTTASSATAQVLHSVALVSATDGWAVGDAGTILRGNGTAWSSFSSPTANALYGVSMISATDGFAVGDLGTILRWNGTSWSSFNSPTANLLWAVKMRSATDGWAVGANGTILRWDGSQWSVSNSGTTNWLYGVMAVSATDAWAVGDLGTILHWNGTSWSTVASGTVSPLFGVAMLAANDGYIVGDRGLSLHWNGSTWGHYASSTGEPLRGVAVVEANKGWAVGGGGVILTLPTPPSFTSADNTTFTVGTTGNFTVVASGAPVPTLAYTGTLPAGVTFGDLLNGTGSLSGTPPSNAGGVYHLTFTADNGVPPAASQAFTLTVNNTVPVLTTMGPSSTVVNHADFTLVVTGTGFVNTSIVRWNGSDRVTTFVNATQLSAAITAADLATAGSQPVTVFNPAPGGGPSNALNFVVNTGTTQVALASSPNPSIVGSSVSITATISQILLRPEAVPGGTVTFKNGGVDITGCVNVPVSAAQAVCTTSALPAGPNAISAAYTGDANFLPSVSGTLNQVVDQAPAITSANSTTFNIGVSNLFTVTTTGYPVPAIGWGGTPPSGVTFTDNGNGTATLAGTPANNTSGTYALSFTASNGVGTPATQPFTLTVSNVVQDVPIAGLAATNSSPTKLLHATTFTATVTAGSNITYTWAFGDNSPTVTGPVVTHTYATFGSFTAVVTATNTANSLTATTPVIVWRAVYLPVIAK